MGRGTQFNLLDRAVLGVLGILLLGIAVIAGAHVLGWQGFGSMVAVAEGLRARPVEAIIGAVLLLGGGFYLLQLSSRPEADDAVRQATDIGHVRISMRAIETLVHRTARDVRGIKDVEVKVHPSPEGVAISLAVVVNPDVSIPTVCEEVGRRVQLQVKETVGVDVGDVSIEIRNISAANRQTRVD